jgi:hypothetical protein
MAVSETVCLQVSSERLGAVSRACGIVSVQEKISRYRSALRYWFVKHYFPESGSSGGQRENAIYRNYVPTSENKGIIVAMPHALRGENPESDEYRMNNVIDCE